MRGAGGRPYLRPMSNVQTVQGIYEAFGRGDVPAILERLDDNVRWDHWPDGNGAARRGVPWMVERTGRDDVRGFFETLGGLEFHRFQPTALLEGDGRVVALIDIEVGVKSTGRRIRDSEIHLWTFGADGRVKEFRHYVDTAKHVEAAGR
jgi:ketosteroid isomerase-like protein